MLTHDEVALAYRLLLGREPENDEVVANLCQTVHSLPQLRDAFIESAEFRQRMSETLSARHVYRPRHPFNMPSIPVEVEVSEDALSQMFERIHQEWEFLGETDPYWSVLTQPQYHKDQFEPNRDQFFASGKYMSGLLLAALRRNNVNPNMIEKCLDLGCGVGRVTYFVAQSFAKVIAADISAHHLNIARAYLDNVGVKNVELKQLDTIYAVESLPEVDLVYSVITLQHNPPPVMAWMLKALLKLLKPSGVAYLQIPTYRSGYLFEVKRYLSTTPPKSLEMHFLPQHEIFRIIDEFGCRCLEVREDGMVGDDEKSLSNTFLIQKNA